MHVEIISHFWLLLFFGSAFYSTFGDRDNVSLQNELVSSQEKLFRIFILKYKRPYKIGTPEYFNRFKIFQQSLKRQKMLNAARSDQEDKEISAAYGITQFSDLSQAEFRDMMLNYKEKERVGLAGYNFEPSIEAGISSEDRTSLRFVDPPNDFDWRSKSAVTPVENQRSCGACWAFSVVETVESMNYIKNKELLDLSVQQVINCAPQGHKCQGGDTVGTADWLMRAKINLTTESAYPLTDTSGECNINPKSGVRVEGLSKKTNYIGYEDLMVAKIASHGPLSVTVDAKMWQDYMGGIIQYHCGTSNDHAVQIVGYKRTGRVPYFIVRNSWGTDFGHQGYIYIEIGKNMCGIAKEVLSLETA